ncbi:MAG TPA: ATP-binding protein, partial [Bacteroidales bacterium]|nr:ATP-binding protein [Bacteroidales bacterium]
PEFSKKGRWRGEATGMKKDGSGFPQEVSLTALDNGGLICIVRDITERKQTEFALRKAKNKAEESDKLKSAFLANVSHEIRTPMNGILGFANLLEENDLSKEEHHNYLQVIQRSGNRMLNIINDLIDISRVESGQSELHFKPCDLNAVFQEQYEFFRNEAKQNNIDLIVDIQNLCNKVVLCDKTKLSQILTNLIKNALKYTDEGEIRVEAKCEDQRLYCSVSDTGMGIPKDKLKVIFNRFSQVKHDDGRVFEGAGLGLSITQAFVKMMDGNISVSSEEGKGSCFSFDIAVEAPEDEDEISEPSKDDIKDISDKTILVVEDDPGSVRLIKALLGRMNPGKILIANNGKEALRLVDEYADINLVLLDIRLPEMDGFTVCNKIKQMRPGIPVVAQTAFAADVDKTEALRLGFDDYLSKPIIRKELAEKVKRYAHKIS